ncbi:MAG TPA: hypothetical protein ENN13_05600 [Candidatus Altiarchaeales archaeon]|nr:hypothetical protein [Candidatus Altiarchaeales archaeon]
MFEIIYLGLDYIRGVPQELTEKAVKSGMIRPGSILGIRAESAQTGEQLGIEIRLTEPGQSRLIKEGMVVPLEEGSQPFRIHNSWPQYLSQVVITEKKTEAGNERIENYRIRKNTVMTLKPELTPKPA